MTRTNASSADVEALQLLDRLGVVTPGTAVELVPLVGGVSSDIWLVRTEGREIVLKRALGQLRVEADWRAPVDRGATEAAWLEYVAGIEPGAVPKVLAYDSETHAIALEYLDPARFGNWKSQLMAGDANVAVASELGRVLGRIHSASTHTVGLAERFANQAMFETLRIEPYFLRTATAVPQVAPVLHQLVDGLRSTQRALIHGDMSPKNILVGDRIILLDAECATWGDPAFDGAFVLAHLTLKALHLSAYREKLNNLAREFESNYLAQVDWEDPVDLATRIARLTPALLLARVAGASPVEYLSRSERDVVHAIAVHALLTGESVSTMIDGKGGSHD